MPHNCRITYCTECGRIMKAEKFANAMGDERLCAECREKRAFARDLNRATYEREERDYRTRIRIHRHPGRDSYGRTVLVEWRGQIPGGFAMLVNW